MAVVAVVGVGAAGAVVATGAEKAVAAVGAVAAVAVAVAAAAVAAWLTRPELPPHDSERRQRGCAPQYAPHSKWWLSKGWH